MANTNAAVKCEAKRTAPNGTRPAILTIRRFLASSWARRFLVQATPSPAT